MFRLSLTVLTVATMLVAGDELRTPGENPDPKISAVAKKCCPEKEFQCCYDAIDFHHRLDCEQIPEGTMNETMRCIQREMHGAADVERISINHIGCCEAFKNDFTDANHRCYESCKYVLNVPGLSSKVKMFYIKHCREKNELSQCFNLCRVEQNEHVSKGLPESDYKYAEPDTCARYKMRSDELYPIKQIMRM